MPPITTAISTVTDCMKLKLPGETAVIFTAKNAPVSPPQKVPVRYASSL